MDKIEEHFYAIAGDEIAERKLHKATYAKAVEEAMGNTEKITSLYIRNRVRQLKEEHQIDLQMRAEESERIRKKREEEENRIRKEREEEESRIQKKREDYKNRRTWWICKHCNERNKTKNDVCVKCGETWVIPTDFVG